VDAKRQRRLLPLLVAVPIALGTLSGLTYSALAAARERWRHNCCISVLKNAFGYALHLYSEDFGGAYPPTIGYLYPNYVSDGDAFLCPSAGRATALEDDPRFLLDGRRSVKHYAPPMFGDTHTDYVYVSGLRSADSPGYILAFDDEWNHDGDGAHVDYTSGWAEWRGDGDGAYVVCIGGQVEWRGIAAVHEQLDRQEKELAARGREMKLIRPAWSAWPDPSITGHPLAGPRSRPWYRRRNGSAILFGASAALVTALLMSAVVMLRQRRRGSGDAA